MGMTDTGALDSYRFLAIDPGTNSAGIAILDVNPDTLKPHVEHAMTLNVAMLLKDYEHVAQVHGDKIAKLIALERALLRMMNAWSPNWVVSEAPYMGRFPQAYAALIECLSAARRALTDYNPILPLDTIDPASVKTAVNVSGKSGDKTMMSRAIRNLVQNGKLVINPEVNLSMLDEHAIDAIAVGYAKYIAKFKL